MSQQLIVLDSPPDESAPWALEVFKRAKLTVVSNDAIGDAMGEDEAARKALLQVKDPVLEAEKLAPHYGRVFEAAHGKDSRLGLWGTAWLVYTKPIAACVVDWSSVEKLAANTEKGAERVPYEHFRKSAHDFVAARVKKYLSGDRYLELPAGLNDQQKVDATLAFLKKLSLTE
jgi:hypothetical protein